MKDFFIVFLIVLYIALIFFISVDNRTEVFNLKAQVEKLKAINYQFVCDKDYRGE